MCVWVHVQVRVLSVDVAICGSHLLVLLSVCSTWEHCRLQPQVCPGACPIFNLTVPCYVSPGRKGDMTMLFKAHVKSVYFSLSSQYYHPPQAQGYHVIVLTSITKQIMVRQMCTQTGIQH